MKGRKRQRGGYTMVELLAALALFSILASAVVTLTVPFLKVFNRVRELQYTQSIMDDLVERTALELRGARSVTDPNGGNTMVFLDGEGYIVLISSGGFEGAIPPSASNPGGVPYSFPAGRASQLYCSPLQNGTSYSITAAKGYDGWYGSGFYMGYTAEFSFELGERSSYVEMTVTLYKEGRSFSEQAVIDLVNTPPVVVLTQSE